MPRSRSARPGFAASDGAVMHRHWPLKLVHLRVNNEQHAARIAKALANLGPADALQDDPWQFDAFRANV